MRVVPSAQSGDGMRRRDFLILLVAWPFAARAQQGDRVPRIGVVISAASDVEAKRYLAAFRKGLQELGWTEGRNLALEIRCLDGQLDGSTPLVSNLVRRCVDAIVTEGSQVVQAAREVTSTIPIVMVRIGDAVGAGFAASLARPGGNLTGMSLYATEQGEKRLELLKEILPELTRVTMLWNPKNPSQRFQSKNIGAAALRLNIQLRSLPVPESAILSLIFRMSRERPLRHSSHWTTYSFSLTGRR
jgi:putative tryptophan/tyrosine transport system substrate-binding protein